MHYTKIMLRVPAGHCVFFEPRKFEAVLEGGKLAEGYSFARDRDERNAVAMELIEAPAEPKAKSKSSSRAKSKASSEMTRREPHDPNKGNR